MKIQLTRKEKTLAIWVAVVFFVAVLLPGFLSQATSSFLVEQENLRNTLSGDITDFTDRLTGIEDERETIRQNQEEYLNWVARGVVGVQDPVGWVKSMQKVQRERNLFPLSYELSDEALLPSSVSPFTAGDGSSVRIRLWNMQISMAMLHDLDVLMFLEILKRESSSFFYPIECNFELLEMEFSLSSRENLSSTCLLSWVSVDDPERKQQGGSDGETVAVDTAAATDLSLDNGDVFAVARG